MVAHLEKVRKIIMSFSTYMIEVIPRTKNSHADALAKLSSTKDVELLNMVSVEFLAEPSINQRLVVMEVDQEPSLMDSIAYLKRANYMKARQRQRY